VLRHCVVLGLVFPSSSGGPADAHNFYGRVWKPLLKKAELAPDSRFHQLRHSFATALIAGSENAKTVSTLMGHATAAFTMDTYADYWPDNFEGIATRVSDRLFADVEAVCAKVGSKLVAAEAAEEIPGAQVIEIDGGPCRDRTCDQLIKSADSPYARIRWSTVYLAFSKSYPSEAGRDSREAAGERGRNGCGHARLGSLWWHYTKNFTSSELTCSA
jgi:hypothetical protein